MILSATKSRLLKSNLSLFELTKYALPNCEVIFYSTRAVDGHDRNRREQREAAEEAVSKHHIQLGYGEGAA